ncbi:MAG: ABC transporter ATP-binding protein [Candidatus Omnitrophica bacterium]|nr:ABC transporter ATP-binding protein [Candidatus Omnitrophota bacterium]
MIDVVNVRKSFRGRPVLRSLNLTIKRGETMVIIGRSGCGKSVLLKHIVGLLKPDSGQVLVGGIDITKIHGRELDKIRLKFGMLFQGAALFDSLTVGENVGFLLNEHALFGPDEITRKVAESLAHVGLSGIEHMKPAELSGGMKKRVGLARAICHNPEVIFYDEPTTGIDPIMADVINNLIVALNKKLNTTSIVVTHDMVSAYKVATRIAMLYEGAIIAVGNPDEIRATDNPVVRQFITGAAEGPITEAEQRR